MSQKNILSFFSKQTDRSQSSPPITKKRTLVDYDYDNDSDSESDETVQTKIGGPSKAKKFQTSWLGEYKWLRFENGKMFCQVCKDGGGDNAFTIGTDNFRTSTIRRHLGIYKKNKSVKSEHVSILEKNTLRKSMETASTTAYSRGMEGVIAAMKVVYWLAKENIALEKYASLISLLEAFDCRDIKHLGVADNATYRSTKSGKEFLHSLAETIRDKVCEDIQKSPFVSLLADESTDVSVQKNMVVSIRILDPDTMVPSTHFVTDVKLSGGTGREIFADLKEQVIQKKNIDKSKIIALGTDGAKVMTGFGEGVTGYFMREVNAMGINIHCIAHRLALCSSQAAEKVPFLKGFQDTLTNLFYYFKRSSLRNENLAKIQDVLDTPNIKVKEVHAIRWVAIFEAVEAVYRSLDALITFFMQESRKDPSARGYMLKLTELDFVHSVYMMMDVLPVITKLSLLFQRADLDLPLIPIAVQTCLSDLDELQDHPDKLNGRDTYTSLLEKDITLEEGTRYFKGHILKGKLSIDNIRIKFITNLKENINTMFSDNNVISGFSILGLKPITLLSSEELQDWGNEKLEILIEKFGKDQQVKPRKNYQEETVCTPAMVDPVEVRREWGMLKTLCKNEGYPRHSLSQIWGLINTNHKEAFPNLLTLAQIALVAPTHTADCERAFSHQNLVKTSLRNRLSTTVLDDLLTVNIEGPEKMDFSKVLKKWSADCQRRVYTYK